MKRIAIAELEGAALDSVMEHVCGIEIADLHNGMDDWNKRHTLLWANPSGFVEVPDELVEGE